MTPDEQLQSKRKYIMEEHKRIESRRDTRVSLLNQLSMGAVKMTQFAKDSAEVQAKIVGNNKKTLNPKMGTGEKRDMQRPAIYQPKARKDEEKQAGFQLPAVVSQPPPRKSREMSAVFVICVFLLTYLFELIPLYFCSAVKGSGWSRMQVLELCVLEALGGFSIGKPISIGKLPGGVPAPKS